MLCSYRNSCDHHLSLNGFFDLRINSYQFVQPLSTCVPRADRTQAVLDKSRPQFVIVQNLFYMAGHLIAIACKQQVSARCEKALSVGPVCGHERYATRESF